ncbi:MAG: glycine--tRNA ligase subunit beta [Idiomarina sp.]|nr:glycine--tRNA ligase subunit beta [Idiomarina sp.]
MSQTANLLIELGTEELPPKSLRQLSDSFTSSVLAQIESSKLAFTSHKSYATPRRLAVLVAGVETRQADEVVEKRGPAVSAAFDADGQPTKAAIGWARGNGIEVADAERLVTDKGEWLLHKATVSGQSLEALLPGIVQQAAKQLPVPKVMRWGHGTHAFIRPLQRLTIMLDEQVVAAELFGIKSSNVVLGHRFHSQGDIPLPSASTYEQCLLDAHVVADFAARRAQIETQSTELAKSLKATPVWDDALLDEVTSLVEWPVPMMAEFEARFLAVPKEALIYTMKDDQRYFPLVDSDGELLPQFLFVSNIQSREPKQVTEGNEKVVRPRLSDAEFFFNTDKKKPLASRIEKLDTILFQKELGSIGDKARRIALVAGKIAVELKADQEVAERAGLLAKADLASDMVMEFPEVQGIMGMHYARHDGESEAVAVAIEAHYHPRFAGDSLPSTLEGSAVALADKLDTLVGIFGIGQTPKGDRDPFGLRRAAIGMLRILVESKLDLDLETLVRYAAEAYSDVIAVPDDVQTQIVDFLLGRFRAWYQEQGVATDVIQAVLARRPTRALDFDQRIQAVATFRTNPEADALAAANKRVGNILAKAHQSIGDVSEALLTEAAEIALNQALAQISSNVEAAATQGDYDSVLSALATLRQPVDEFFEHVMVNADDEAVKANRLALLQQLRNQFLRVADISVLQS